MSLRLPPGTILPYLGPSGTQPAGWLLCDGALVPRATYGALFAAIGTTYGAGDGSTTFRLPGTAGYLYASGSGTTSSSSHGYPAHSVTTNVAATLSASTSNQNHGHSMNTGTVNSNARPDPANNLGAHTSANTGAGNNATANGATLGGSTNYLANENHSHSLGINWGHADHSHGINAPTVADEYGHSHTVSLTPTLITSVTSANTDPPYVKVWHLIKI